MRLPVIDAYTTFTACSARRDRAQFALQALRRA
jgi:hypothetical protein